MEMTLAAPRVDYLNVKHSVASWLLTWSYVWWANRHYDPAQRAWRDSTASR